MKKYTKIIAAVLLTVLTLSSCFGGGNIEAFDKLNKLSADLTSNYTLEIKTVSPSSHTLTETYTVTETDGVLNVDCKVERINKFDINGSNVTPPEDYKTVTERALSPEEVMSGLFEVPAFNFSAESLDHSSVKENGLELRCTLRLPEKFMGRSIDGEDITLTVVYTESAIETLTLFYLADGDKEVTITYIFN